MLATLTMIKMNSKQPLLVKIGGLCGVLGPVVVFTCIALAISYSPWFTWTGNWISDLGGMAGETPVWAARGIASIIFNTGLIIAGAMGVMFANAMRKTSMFKSRLGHLGTLLLVFTMATLCAIGVFPEPIGFLHTFVSSVFFILITLSLLFIGTAMRTASEQPVWWFVTFLGGITLCSLPFLLIPRPWGGHAIAEMVPIGSLTVFALVLGSGLLMGKFALYSE
jgi:hypothetical membrane protein